MREGGSQILKRHAEFRGGSANRRRDHGCRRSRGSLRIASAGRPQRAPVMSMRSSTRWRQASRAALVTATRRACTAPPTHSAITGTRKVAGKTQTRRMSPEQADRYRPYFDNNRRLREILSELEAPSPQAVEHAEGWGRNSDREVRRGAKATQRHRREVFQPFAVGARRQLDRLRRGERDRAGDVMTFTSGHAAYLPALHAARSM